MLAISTVSSVSMVSTLATQQNVFLLFCSLSVPHYVCEHCCLSTTTLAVHTTQGKGKYCLPHFFFLGGGDPTTATLRSSGPWCVAPDHPRMMMGATTPSCTVYCHSYYNVQQYFPLEKVCFFLPQSL